MTFAVFQDFPGLENGLPKFHDFPGPVITLDIVRFKIKVGVEEKFMYKNVTLHTQHGDCHSRSKAAPPF